MEDSHATPPIVDLTLDICSSKDINVSGGQPWKLTSYFNNFPMMKCM